VTVANLSAKMLRLGLDLMRGERLFQYLMVLGK
jgi:hypothetical protein